MGDLEDRREILRKTTVKVISIRRVERNFALFSKEFEDLVLVETAGCGCQLTVHGRLANEPTNPPNMASQVQEFFKRGISRLEAVRSNQRDKPMCSPS